MPSWQAVVTVVAISAGAVAARAADLRPAWECLPDDTVLMVRVPGATAFVEELETRTKLGGYLARPDRLESLWELLAEQNGGGTSDAEGLEENLREYGLELSDLTAAGDRDLGAAILVRRREGLPPLAMILAWAEPGPESAARILEAAKRRIEEAGDSPAPHLERTDFELAGREVVSVVEPVMGLDLRGLELDQLAGDADEGESDTAARLEAMREKIRAAKPVQTGQAHSYLTIIDGRILAGSTIQAARPLGQGDAEPESFEPRCGGDESRQIFEAFLAAHEQSGEPSLARVFAEPVIAATALPGGTPLVEAVFLPQPLLAAAEEEDEIAAELARFGLDDLGGIAWRHALSDGCWRSVLGATLPAPRHGILAALDQQCDACDIPSFVTSETVGFTQISLDLGAAFRSMRELLPAAPDSEQVANMLMVADVQSQTWLGADVATVLSGLGSRHWVLSFPPRVAAALAKAREAARGAGGGEPVAADALALVWAIQDEAPFLKLLGRLAPLAGGELQDEQGFRGLRVPGGAAAFVGRGHLVVAIGEGTLEKTLSAIRNPPSGQASLRDSGVLGRARELVPLPPARMFGVTDATKTGGTLGMLRDFAAGLEPEDVADTYRELLAAGQKLLPTAREMEGMFGVGSSVLRMTDDGVVFETAWELPPP
ncbi:MAG: hypothetical protein RLZZ440_2607 [Planctomycetota bacterium]